MQRVTRTPITHSHPTVEELHDAKRKRRTVAIDRLVAEAAECGDCADRMYWTLIYDFEHAPMTTNLAQLKESGVCPPVPESLSDAELLVALWDVICGLGDLGIFLMHTNHLDDRTLYERLMTRILIEPVRDLPPDSDVHEFIDLVGGGGTPEREIYQAHYATADERTHYAQESGCEVPLAIAPSDRDRDLPKPDSSARCDSRSASDGGGSLIEQALSESLCEDPDEELC